jgi:hypothetical protein
LGNFSSGAEIVETCSKAGLKQAEKEWSAVTHGFTASCDVVKPSEKPRHLLQWDFLLASPPPAVCASSGSNQDAGDPLVRDGGYNVKVAGKPSFKVSSAFTPPPPEGFVSLMTWGVASYIIEMR